MSFPDSWGALDWLVPISLILLICLGVIIRAYWQVANSSTLRTFLGITKFSAIVLLCACLLEPMYRLRRPEKGANLMVVMADDSQSLQIKDRGKSETRETELRNKLNQDSDWLSRLSDDFDVRRYQFDRRLRPVSNFSTYQADQRGSDILNNLELVARRFTGRPSAGIILLTDGNVTDSEVAALDTVPWQDSPPIYPVVVGESRPAKDLAITQVSSTQTNFESAPVTVTVEMVAHGYAGQRVAVRLLDENGVELERQEVARIEDGRRFAVRFKTRPEKRGVNVFQVEAFADGEDSDNQSVASSAEATIVNNRRMLVVDRGRGPYRVLYVTGRPNWELKFLRRSIQGDEELDLVALVRIAKREAKFTFLGREGQKSNSLFRGFESQDDDTTEQHDEPVFIRLGTEDKEELLGGFPKDAETLFKYDGIVLDDLEADFFTEEQKSLVQQFVSLRGGGLLMLGGQESFGGGQYDRTQIGEILPVYLDRIQPRPDAQYQLNLTREGWLQPWVRIESTEEKERRRLTSMPKFKTLNLSDSIKPGATVLASVTTAEQREHPALVVQPFGKGRAGALLIGDFWRWQLKSDNTNDDLMKAWRQTLRWLVADAPRRVEVEVVRKNDVNRTSQIIANVRDESFKPLDNASVQIDVQTPDGKLIEMTAEPSETEPGTYFANFVSGESGAYRALVRTAAPDGTEIEQREAGWVSEPDSEEFQSLVPNRSFLESLAKQSGGEVLELDQLDAFVKSLDHREVPITESKSLPWWHRWTIFLIAIGLLVGEWGIRRWKGLP